MKLQSGDSNRKRRKRPYVYSVTAVNTTLLLLLVASQSLHSASAIGGRRDDAIVDLNDHNNDIDEGDFNNPLLSGGTRRNRLLVHRNRLLALNINDEESMTDEEYGVDLQDNESAIKEDVSLLTRLLGSHKGPHTEKKAPPKKKNDKPPSSSSIREGNHEEKKLNKREKKDVDSPKKKKSHGVEKLNKLEKKGKKNDGGSNNKKTTMGKKEEKAGVGLTIGTNTDDGMKLDKKDTKLAMKNNNPDTNMTQKKDKKQKKEEWKAHGKSSKSKSSKGSSSSWWSSDGGWDKKNCVCVEWSNDWNEDVELWTTGGGNRFDTTTGIDKRDGTIDTTEKLSAAARFAMPNNRELGRGWTTTTSSKSGKSKGSKEGDDDDDWDHGWDNKKKCKEWKCDKPGWSSRDSWSDDGWSDDGWSDDP